MTAGAGLLGELRRLGSGFVYSEPYAGVEGYRLFYNENLFLGDDYYRALIEGVSVEDSEIRFYGDPYCRSLSESIAEFLGVDPDMVFVGRGVDSLISIIVDVAVTLRKKLVIVEPTFEMYRFKAEAKGYKVSSVLLREDFTLDLERVRSSLDDDSTLVICSPNNPTGNQFDREDILSIVEGFKGLVVVDETYAEYGRYTLVGDVEDHENLVVLRSFSKAWGLAGLRAGYSVCHPDVARAFARFSDPYPMSSLTKKIVARALSLSGYVREAVRETIKVREYMFEEMRRISGIRPYPSDANFIFFRARDSRRLLEGLTSRGFLIRDVSSKPLCEGGLRVTVPPREIAERFLEAVRDVLGG